MEYRIRSFIVRSVVVAGLLFVATSPALAQHVASIYLDAAADESTIWAIVNTGDGSSDCQHTGYFTGGWLNGPSGFNSGGQPGFSTSVSLPGDDGDYTEGGYLSFDCGCYGGFTSPDTIQLVKLSTTWYGSPRETTDSCIYEGLACTSGSPSCAALPFTVTGVPPCAPFQKTRWLVINGSCFLSMSTGTGSNVTARVCI
jgi:hypothetical protein